MTDIMHILSHIAKVRSGTEEKMRLLDELESSVIIEGIKAGRIGLGPAFKSGSSTPCCICRVVPRSEEYVVRLTIGRLAHEKCMKAVLRGNEDVPY